MNPIRKPWYVKPPSGTRIDWGHPLAKGLKAAWTFNEGAGLTTFDIAGIRHGVIGTAPAQVQTWSGGKTGVALRGAASVSQAQITIPALPTGTKFTWESLIKYLRTNLVFQDLVSDAGNDGFYLRGLTDKFDYFYAGVDHFANTTFVPGNWYHLALVADGTNGKLYVNGVDDGVVFPAVPGFSANAMLNDTGVDPFEGICEYQRFWNRSLSQTEVRDLLAKPYDMFVPARRTFLMLGLVPVVPPPQPTPVMPAFCDPQALNDAARCFVCIPDPLKGQVNISLLRTITGSTATLQQLISLSTGFQIFSGSPALAAEVYLLAKIAGVTTDPSALATLATCYWCKNYGFLEEVTTYLLVVQAMGSTNPRTLQTGASAYTVLFGSEWRVELYLFCQWALMLGKVPNCDPATLMTNAKCLLNCLSPFILRSIRAYLLCQIVGSGAGTANLVPSGSTYGPGPSNEFDLTVLPFTCYQVCWGANDVSLTLPVSKQIFLSTGAGTCITVYTSSDTVMQFFGTAAGTTVTVSVKGCNCAVCLPTASGFDWAAPAAGTTLVANFDTPAAGIATTELWTSADNITYALAGTVAAPAASISVAAPAIGSFLYGKIRWLNSSAQAGPFTDPQLMSGQVSDWVKRVNTNGGARPSSVNQRAMSTFDKTLVDNAMASKIWTASVFAPDNLIAAITPLYKTAGNGNDPWTNNGPFVGGDLTVNGLKGDGVAKYLNAGFNIITQGYADYQDLGITLYCSLASNSATADYGVLDSPNTFAGPNLQIDNGGVSYFECPSGNPPLVNAVAVANPLWAGYLSGNREIVGPANLYKASSGFPHAIIGTNAVVVAVGPTPLGAYCFGINYAGGILFSDRRLSFAAEHRGWTAAQSLIFFNAIQALRTAFGGGFV